LRAPIPKHWPPPEKKQNTRRDLAQSIHKIYAAGMYVMAGFIVGFDTEKPNVAEAMIDLIEESAIPVCMVGLLYALPNTQLTRRLAQEARLHDGHDLAKPEKGDQCSQGLNFETARPRQEILRDCQRVLERIYDPVAFFGRLDRLAGLLDCSVRRRTLPEGDKRLAMSNVQTVREFAKRMPGQRNLVRKTLTACLERNPAALRSIVTVMSLYLHLGPFARQAAESLERQIRALEGSRLDLSPEFDSGYAAGTPAGSAQQRRATSQ
jgi:hypothetical protein